MTPTLAQLFEGARACRRHLVMVAWAALLACCTLTPQPKPEWQSSTVTASSERILWEVTVQALVKSGFPIGTGLEPGKLVATSGWMVSLAPFRGKGFREQCEVRYAASGERAYKVDVRVRREKNDDLLHPLDLSYADWVPEPDNGSRAQIVLQYIKSMLATAKKPAASKG